MKCEFATFVFMFEALKGNGRVWIYTANRKLTPDEQANIKQQLDVFCSSWNAHGNQLTAQFDVLYDQVMVLAVDEDVEAASGCSIDQATAIFRSLDTQYSIDLFNRLNLAFLKDNRIQLVHLSDTDQAYRTGLISDDTLLLNNTLSSLHDLREQWQVRFSDSWAFRRVKKIVEKA